MKEKKNTTLQNKTPKKLSKLRIFFGILFFIASFVMSISFISYLFNWESDQSQAGYLLDKTVKSENILGKFGNWLGNLFVFEGVGISSFILAFLCFVFGSIILKKKYFKPWKTFGHSLFFICWTPLFFGAITNGEGILSGVYGYQGSDFLSSFIGKFGLWMILLVSIALYFILEFNLRLNNIKTKLNQATNKIQPIIDKTKNKTSTNENEETRIKNQEPIKDHKASNIKIQEEKTPSSVSVKTEEIEQPKTDKINTIVSPTPLTIEKNTDNQISTDKDSVEDVGFSVEIAEEKDEEDNTYKSPEDKSAELVEQVGEYDHKLDLPNFQLPSIDLLKSYGDESISVNKEELEENKNKIVSVLKDFKVQIKEIKATIGPTVTLYEIVPEAGVRVSAIKKLQDDIALNLSALGIRIIAPIPGRGTIGIEVPSKNPAMVSMRSVINSQKFKNSKMDLPVVFGKTISNEIFMADLAKMPHLLMAGATGQGKSVGINAILTSLLYKKHPSEIKFVMVDPKKVELTLYSKIERHYLAKLPDAEEAIITDTNKVINTLNSLCIEMDERYDLLKKAFCRNIKEYNAKFKQRKLNPENGHRFLPYIVLVVDEFADLIMTAGKEIEQPIARLAQLARAIGIHLIVATQRPSVNVITGMIKANFPARAAFRVMTGIDSKTILDSPGAEQLIGRGDMLFSNGNDTLRLQCAFVDTPEVERIADYIGEQKGFANALLLPEYEGEESSSAGSFDANERDALFEEAARMVVSTQQGSTSMLQRQLKLGYNRAGRIMDQLEASGIVGGFNGSKAREVQITDPNALEQFLENLKK